MSPGERAIEILHLRKTYGQAIAADDVTFSVTEGEIFGILGQNGAGKATTVECAVGFRASALPLSLTRPANWRVTIR